MLMMVYFVVITVAFVTASLLNAFVAFVFIIITIASTIVQAEMIKPWPGC